MNALVFPKLEEIDKRFLITHLTTHRYGYVRVLGVAFKKNLKNGERQFLYSCSRFGLELRKFKVSIKSKERVLNRMMRARSSHGEFSQTIFFAKEPDTGRFSFEAETATSSIFTNVKHTPAFFHKMILASSPLPFPKAISDVIFRSMITDHLSTSIYGDVRRHNLPGINRAIRVELAEPKIGDYYHLTVEVNNTCMADLIKKIIKKNIVTMDMIEEDELC